MFLKEGPTLYARAANEMIPFNNIYFLGALFPPPDSVAKLGRKGTKWLSLHSEPVQDKIRTPYIHFFKQFKSQQTWGPCLMVWNRDLPQAQLIWNMCPECYMGEKDAIVFEPEGKLRLIR